LLSLAFFIETGGASGKWAGGAINLLTMIDRVGDSAFGCEAGRLAVSVSEISGGESGGSGRIRATACSVVFPFEGSVGEFGILSRGRRADLVLETGASRNPVEDACGFMTPGASGRAAGVATGPVCGAISSAGAGTRKDEAASASCSKLVGALVWIETVGGSNNEGTRGRMPVPVAKVRVRRLPK